MLVRARCGEKSIAAKAQQLDDFVSWSVGNRSALGKLEI